MTVGASPSGKAAVFGTAIPRFESWRPSQKYKKITFSKEGKIIGETSYDHKTDNVTREWYTDKKTRDHFEHTYNPRTGGLITEKRYQPPFSGDADTLEAKPGLGPLKEITEYHEDGETERLSTEYDDGGMPARAMGNYANGDRKSIIKYDEQGKVASKTVQAKGSEELIYEYDVSYTKKNEKKITETLHISTDPEIESIEREFYPSGRVKKETMLHRNKEKSDLDFYDLPGQQVSQQILLDARDDIKVRRFYEKGVYDKGARKASSLDVDPDSPWQNRIEVRKSRMVFGRPSKTTLIEVSAGCHHIGCESILDNKVSLLLRGDKTQLENAKRKIEKALPGIEAKLETREVADYDRPGFKREHVAYGGGRKRIDVLSVVMTYGQDADHPWPVRHYSLGQSNPQFFEQKMKEAHQQLLGLVKKVHSYTGCDLGLTITPSVYKHGNTHSYGSVVKIEPSGESYMEKNTL